MSGRKPYRPRNQESGEWDERHTRQMTEHEAEESNHHLSYHPSPRHGHDSGWRWERWDEEGRRG